MVCLKAKKGHAIPWLVVSLLLIYTSIPEPGLVLYTEVPRGS